MLIAVVIALGLLNVAWAVVITARHWPRAPLPPPLPPPLSYEFILDFFATTQERTLASLADAIAKSTAAVNVPASNLPPPPPSGSPGPVTWYDQQLPDDRDPTDFYLPSDSRLEGAVIDSDEPFGIPGLRREGASNVQQGEVALMQTAYQAGVNGQR